MKKALLFFLLSLLLISFVIASDCVEMGACKIMHKYTIKDQDYIYMFNPYTHYSKILVIGKYSIDARGVPLRTQYNIWFKQCDYSDFLKGGWSWPEETVKKKTAECMNGFTSFKEYWVAFHA